MNAITITLDGPVPSEDGDYIFEPHGCSPSLVKAWKNERGTLLLCDGYSILIASSYPNARWSHRLEIIPAEPKEKQ